MRSAATAAAFVAVASAQQSAYQKALFEKTNSTAAAAAAAARPHLLTALDDPTFRTALTSCCPDIAQDSAQDLLDRLVAETRITEVVTGLPAGQGPSREFAAWSTSLEDAVKRDTFDNQWVNAWVHGSRFIGHSGGWFEIQDNLEMGFYKFKPFSHPARPASLEECEERNVYALVNSMRSDMGSPLYGNLTLVLSNKAVRDSLLLSAVDTGEWAEECNITDRPSGWPDYAYEHNCSAYAPIVIGTLDNFEHLILDNLHYWNYTSVAEGLARRIEQLFYPWKTPVKAYELAHYWEAAPATQLQNNESFRFLLGSFPKLFGSETGNMLRNFSDKYSLPLVWSLGLNTDKEIGYWDTLDLPSSLPSNNRFLDAHSAHCNATNATAAIPALDKFWQTAATLRDNSGTPSEWASLYKQVTAAMPGSLVLRPITTLTCADTDGCIGVGADGDCVCRV